MSRKRWASPNLRRALNAKTRAIQLDRGQRDLPIGPSKFADVTDADLTEFLDKLGEKTASPIQYWAKIFGAINCYLIDERMVGKGRDLLSFVNENAPHGVQGGFLLLFSYFRLSEQDELMRLRKLSDRNAEMKARIKSAKKHARQLHRLIPQVCTEMGGLSMDLEDFGIGDGEAFAAVDLLSDRTLRLDLTAIARLAQQTKEMPLSAIPALVTAVDMTLYPGGLSRDIDYSVAEKRALLAMYDLLRANRFSKNKAAETIAAAWDILGPLREPWEFADSRQALRRALDRWKKAGQ